MVCGDAGRQTAGQRGSVTAREERSVAYRIAKERAWLD